MLRFKASFVNADPDFSNPDPNLEKRPIRIQTKGPGTLYVLISED